MAWYWNLYRFCHKIRLILIILANEIDIFVSSQKMQLAGSTHRTLYIDKNGEYQSTISSFELIEIEKFDRNVLNVTGYMLER